MEREYALPLKLNYSKASLAFSRSDQPPTPHLLLRQGGREMGTQGQVEVGDREFPTY